MSDIEQSILRLVQELTAKVDRLNARLDRVLKKPTARELLPARQVDIMFRLRKGTAAKHCAAGLIPCAEKTRGGQRAYLIKVEDAEALWGAK